MGRIVDLCGEVAAAAEEGSEGLVLPPEDWQRLREDWSEEDIEDALGLVHDSLLQGELLEATESLSARLVEALGQLGEEDAFKALAASEAGLSIETIGQLVRRINRVEEILEVFRDTAGPDRSGFDTLSRRLADYGIEAEMARDPEEDEEEEE
jgi:hypothetical protein